MRGELIPEGSEQFFTQFNPNACVVGADDCITKWYFSLGRQMFYVIIVMDMDSVHAPAQ